MENFDKYTECTKAQNWEGLCELNGVNLDSFGTKKELKALPDYLEPDETVFALASGFVTQTITSDWSDSGLNTWLVVFPIMTYQPPYDRQPRPGETHQGG